jgi:hypothetical protein
MYMYMYINIYIYVYVDIDIYVYIYVYICIYVYIYVYNIYIQIISQEKSHESPIKAIYFWSKWHPPTWRQHFPSPAGSLALLWGPIQALLRDQPSYIEMSCGNNGIYIYITHNEAI